MSAKYLLEVLRNEELYLARSDRFKSDHFEAITPQQLLNLLGMITNGKFDYKVTNENFSESDKNEIESKSKKIIEETRASLRNNQKETYISCWYNADHESAVLWDRCSSDSTIALRFDKNYIESIIANSKEILKSSNQSFCGNLEYYNYHDLYNLENLEGDLPFYRKHIGFQAEQEYRIVLHRPGLATNHIYLSLPELDLAKLKIYYHPKMSDANKARIQEAIKKIDKNIYINNSDLQVFYTLNEMLYN